MKYKEISPDNRLKQYVKCYYIYQSDEGMAFEDTVLPSGCVEIIFNLGAGKWQTDAGEGFVTTPAIELWGQIIRPLPVRSVGKNTMLGVRFFPHAAGCFLNDKLDLFNNQVVDLGDVSGNEVRVLYSKLLETSGRTRRIGLVETYLLQKLLLFKGRFNKIALVGEVMNEINGADFFDNISNVADRYGITSRYLQKLFLQYTGLTPKLYGKINRFQQSLRLVTKKEASSLTAIAYDCGYFDQSHFIKEFKSFTGSTPSGYIIERSPVTSALVNN